MAMINLSTINFNFKNLQNKYKSVKNTFPSAFAGAANLAPLQKDTVTFSGRSPKIRCDSNFENGRELFTNVQKRDSKVLSSKSDMGSMKVAHNILQEEDICFAFDRFKTDISSIFGVEVIDFTDKELRAKNKERYKEILSDNIKNGSSILAVSARKKEAASIKEKMGSKKITTKKAAKQEITDILGMRITLSGTSKDAGNYVVRKLTKAVEQGKIKVVEIENYVNPEFKYPEKYQYAGETVLANLMKASINNGVKDCKYERKYTESGYTAIHMLLEFPGGVKGELQIGGLDVFNLKDVEDLCFKALTNKALKHEYKSIESMFAPLKNDDEKYRRFMDYTRNAYAYERAKSPHPLGDDEEFLTLPKNSGLEPEYDFNNIARLKKEIDKKTELDKMLKKKRLLASGE